MSVAYSRALTAPSAAVQGNTGKDVNHCKLSSKCPTQEFPAYMRQDPTSNPQYLWVRRREIWDCGNRVLEDTESNVPDNRNVGRGRDLS